MSGREWSSRERQVLLPAVYNNQVLTLSSPASIHEKLKELGQLVLWYQNVERLQAEKIWIFKARRAMIRAAKLRATLT